MVITLGNNIINAYTGGVQVKEIYSFGVKVWPVSMPGPANNEIWYTSTDGNIVTPYITTSFGANIVSNSYSGGYGVIEFDGPVLEIGVYHFKDCVKLESITLPSSVVEIASRSFEGCTGLISITIPPPPASNIYIGNGVFDGCTGLTSVTIPESVSRLGQSIFYGCTGLTSFMIPSSVTNVGVGVLSGCPNLSSITVNSNNTVYDSRNSCDAIIETSTNKLIQGCKNTVIPSSVTSIEQAAFYGVEFTSIIIPSSVTNIGYQSFEYCNRLTSITIPSSVTNIKSRAFYGCSRLSEVVVEAVVPPALSTADVFTSTASTLLIKVPSGSVETYKTSTGWSNYSSIIVGYDDIIDFSTLGLETSTAYANVPFTSGDLTVEFTGLSNYPAKYYSSDKTMRVYNSGVINISSPKTIKEIVFTWSGATTFRPDADYATPAGYDTTTEKWTGSSSSVVMTRPSTTGHWKLKEVTVIYDS